MCLNSYLRSLNVLDEIRKNKTVIATDTKKGNPRTGQKCYCFRIKNNS